jgi:SAM-dependent methyltransferase
MKRETRDRKPHAVQDLASRRWKGEKILRLLDLPVRETAWRVLEVGTGSGGIAHYLATHPNVRCAVTSVDVVDVRTIRDGYRFLQVTGTQLPFCDDDFDIVITNHVIEHVGDRDAQRAHLRECARVLAPGGRGYLAVPNRWMLVEPHFRLPFLSWLPRRFRDAYVRATGKGAHYDCEPLTVGEIEGLLTEARVPFANATLRALRETVAIEGARGIVERIANAMPDAFWRRTLRAMPTLIYRFGEGAASSAQAVPHQ